MAFIRKRLAKSEYTMADNNIVRDSEISDQAVRLYWYLASNKNGFNLNDSKIISDLSWSQRKVTTYKKELSRKGFILIEKVDQRTYIMYIGSTEISAKKVRENWLKLEDDVQPISRKELKEMRDKCN